MQVIKNFTAQRHARREDRADGPQRRGQDDAAEVAARECARAWTSTDVRASTRGTVKWGHEAQVGYFAQDHRESIQHGHDGARLAAQLRSAGVARKRSAACSGRCCSAAKKGMKPTDALSGGEAARLIFCKLMLQKPNCWCFDEPTNHLDLESINALNIALQKYEGTVLLVTHDHDLIDEVATRIWHFDGRDRRLQGAVRGISGGV